ncbi:glucokinase [Sphingomonas solaris]|uniref:Glucokinase n=1 Tax=Alterirhizorhabdus solaris TaxID=2529389 RepID=A0A558R8A0_9SPHN|nr:glucokinase [Sphingomonas solaris]TVV75623.1 glucokinase [Sphingomonas solaris]
MTEIVAVDIGGTHARFAIATVEGRRVLSLDGETTLKAAEYASFQTAWEAFATGIGRPLPRAAGIAIACPVQGEVLKLTNNPWIIRPALIPAKLGVDAFTLVNDFGAVGHAVAQVGPDHLRHLCGPERPLDEEGVVTIVGPGTGLGVAALLRRGGRAHVIETEGGHIDFAPLDTLEEQILDRLRSRYRRVSIERIVSGPGLANIYEALAGIEGRSIAPFDDKALWTAALEGSDSLAAAAFDRFCLSLGAVAGDLALAQGGTGVVIAGGLGLRIADHLPRSGFSARFRAKGRFEGRMAQIPVKLITHPQPGLLGAAAAFAEEHER